MSTKICLGHAIIDMEELFDVDPCFVFQEMITLIQRSGQEK